MPPKTGDFVQPITSVLPHQSSNTIDVNNKEAQTYSKKKIILFIFIILFLIILIPIVALYIRNNNIEKLAYIPSYLPLGFVSDGADPLLQNLDGQESVIQGFANKNKDLLLITQYSQPNFNCNILKPQEDSRVTSEYKVITFGNGKEGCFTTFYGKDRFFNWKLGEMRIIIHAIPKAAATDDELIKIANSLTLQKIKVITKLPNR